MDPDYQSWSGCQWFNPEIPGEGCLLVFRERTNHDAENETGLRFLKPVSRFALDNLLTVSRTTIVLQDQGAARLAIGAPGGVAFLKFTVE
jgi:hypothetical protein